MAVVVLHVPEVLRAKLGSDGAKALVDLLNDASGPLRDDVLTMAEERFRRHLAEELGLFRHEITREFTLLRQHVTQEIADVRVQVASAEARLTWKLFYFWSAHLVAIAGLLLAFFRFFR
ncbi:MAG: LA_3696 family protein [Gemmatimonadota bacterium]